MKTFTQAMRRPTRVRLTRLLMACTAVAAASVPLTAAAADPAPAPLPSAQDRLSRARDLVRDSRWSDAVAELRRLNERRSADWHNLLGFSLRKMNPPDLAAAERHYDEALRLDPRHRGALEYSGELYLMKGDLARAEARLAELQRACPEGCEELDDLKGAIAQFKAGGPRRAP